MATKQHPKNKHHCYNLDDCRGLLERLGYHMSDASFENDEEAAAISKETTQTALHLRASGEVRLNKVTGVLTVTDRNK